MTKRRAVAFVRRQVLIALLAACAALLVVGSAGAQSCGPAPQGYGGAWWRQYAAWCRCMGGTPNADTVSCTPGSGSGGGGGPTCPAGEVLMSAGGCMPAGAVECSDGTYCRAGLRCGSGNFCLDAGKIDCGDGHWCRAGESCLAGGRCLAKGGVDCGTYTCPAGAYCGSNRSCLATGTVDCGDGRSCPAGTRCGSAKKCFKPGTADCGGGRSCGVGQVCRKDGGCMPEGGIDCGTFGCPAGTTCGSGQRCLAAGSVDCGNGRSCRAGTVCIPSGGCMPEGATACGDRGFCRPGTHCTPSGRCVADDAGECDDGRVCRAGTHCGSGGGCVADDAMDCGSYSCPKGSACGTGGGCRPVAAVPCGVGAYCQPGKKCRLKGGGPDCVATASRPEATPPRGPVDQQITQLEAIQRAISDITLLRSYQKDLTAAVNVLALPWVVDVPLADEMQRAVVVERTRNRLRDLEAKILAAVIIRMRADTRVLEPFPWDTPDTMAQKRQVAEQTAQELAALQARAAKELDAPSTFQERPYQPSSGLGYYYQRATTGFSTTIDFKPGPSLRRLEEIKRTGQFWD